MKTIIIEDEQNNLELLIHFLNTYCPEVQICGVADSVNSGVKLFNEKKPELVFLDIMLQRGTGFQFLESVEIENTAVIFTTAYQDYAIKAFKHCAVDYLLKPLQIDELIQSVEKAKEKQDYQSSRIKFEELKLQLEAQAEKDKETHLAINMLDKIELVNPKEIVLIKADGKYSEFLMSDGSQILSSVNLGEYEKTFKEKTGCEFYRVHHSYLINIKQISSLKKVNGLFCEMKSGISVPISRRKKSDFISILKKSII